MEALNKKLAGVGTAGAVLHCRKKGGPAVPSAAYFRRQADICLRLSLIASDDADSTRLLAMSRHYQAVGEALERQAAETPLAGRSAGDDVGGPSQELPVRSDPPTSPSE
jgi:hypothetical protein